MFNSKSADSQKDRVTSNLTPTSSTSQILNPAVDLRPLSNLQASINDPKAQQSEQFQQNMLQMQQTEGNQAVAQLFANNNGPAAQNSAAANAINGITIAENEAVKQLTSGQVDLHASGASLKHVSTYDPRLQQVNARSMTVGGQALVGVQQDRGHEIWHLAQQMQNRVSPTKTINNQQINDDTGLEKEADQMGAKINNARVDSLALSNVSAVQSPLHTTTTASNFAQQPVQRKLVNRAGQVVDILPSQEEHPKMEKSAFKAYKKKHRERITGLDKEVREELDLLLPKGSRPAYIEQLIWSTMKGLHRAKHRKYNPQAVARTVTKHINSPGDLEYPIQDDLSTLVTIPDENASVADVQEAEQLAKLFAVAIESVKDLNQLTDAMAAAGGGKYDAKPRPFPGIKSMSRAAFKGVIKKESNYALLGDILASSIVYENVEELAKALPRIKNFVGQINYLNVKGFKNRFAKVSPQGYRDILMNFTLPTGHIAEIQLHIKNMIDAKKEGHKYYEDERTVSELYEFVEDPMVRDIKEDMPSGLAGQHQQVKAMYEHVKRIRKGGDQSETAAKWKLQSANQETIEKTESINKSKVQFVKDLQVAAKENVYGKAWYKELLDFNGRHGSAKSWIATLRKIESFELKATGKAQNIDADYKKMFGSDKLLQIHQKLFQEAYKEIAENKELVFSTDWEKLSVLPKSKHLDH